MIKRKIFTIPQFLSERYNWGVGLAFSIFWLFLYVFINLTSVAWLGALAIKQILGLPDAPAIILGMQMDMTILYIMLFLFIIAGVYSIYGGLASVAWTDVMQVTFLVGGGLVTAYAALDVISTKLELNGALDALSYIMGHLSSISGDTHFNLIVERNADLYPVLEGTANQPSDPFFDIPGITVIIGALWLTNLGYWGFNQYIIQKGLAAKSLAEAKKGMIFAAFLKILIPFIVCIPGVCAFYIVNYQPELMQTLTGSIERSDDAYPFLIRNFTPTVVKGLSFAALAAAVISSLASMFNSTSTIFTMDIYKKFINKTASERKLVSVGRLTSLASLILALIAVYPIMGGADQAFQVIQEYSGFVYPGIVVIFGLGLLWKRASGTAAVVTAIATFVFSIAFKFMMPGTPFLLRMGYVFMVLVVLFYVMLVLAIICYVIGCITVFGDIEAMKNLGFISVFFLGTFFLALWLYLRSNALDTVQDKKAVPIDLSLFTSDRGFTIGSIAVVLVLVVLYITLW